MSASRTARLGDSRGDQTSEDPDKSVRFDRMLTVSPADEAEMELYRLISGRSEDGESRSEMARRHALIVLSESSRSLRHSRDKRDKTRDACVLMKVVR